jgi:hypothetical protein
MSGRNLGKGPGSRGAGGNVIVELALVLPFLLLVVAGIVDLGVLYWEKHVITNASREGARAAAKSAVTTDPLQPAPAKERVSQVEQVVQDYLNRFNLKAPDGTLLVLASGTFSYTWDTTLAPPALTVELKDIPVQLLLLPNIQGLLGGVVTSGPVLLKARTTMAAEWVTPPSP